MTVNELIAKLKQLKAANAEVFIDVGNDGEHCLVSCVKVAEGLGVSIGIENDIWHKIDNQWVLNPDIEDLP